MYNRQERQRRARFFLLIYFNSLSKMRLKKKSSSCYHWMSSNVQAPLDLFCCYCLTSFLNFASLYFITLCCLNTSPLNFCISAVNTSLTEVILPYRFLLVVWSRFLFAPWKHFLLYVCSLFLLFFVLFYFAVLFSHSCAVFFYCYAINHFIF